MLIWWSWVSLPVKSHKRQTTSFQDRILVSFWELTVVYFTSSNAFPWILKSSAILLKFIFLSARPFRPWANMPLYNSLLFVALTKFIVSLSAIIPLLTTIYTSSISDLFILLDFYVLPEHQILSALSLHNVP